MIPADLASRLRLVAQDLPAPVQPVAAQQRIADILSDASAGQRIMAEIQALLPNGTYRAIVVQREITLALPFSAKAGDTLELEVVETEGKLSLSFVANRTLTDTTAQDKESVPTSLSKTGNLIGNLLGGVDEQGGKAKPAPLNANQPIVSTFPEKASDLAPILKDALIKSGMFYEAHQARWVEGKIPTASLLQEPQGKLSSLIPQSTQASNSSDTSRVQEASDHVALTKNIQRQPANEAENLVHSMVKDGQPDKDLRNTESLKKENTSITNSGTDISTVVSRTVTPIHPELTPLVQQQLNALATQTYIWQGQVWPGQNMDWEITEDDGRQRSGEDEVTGTWQTRLKICLPNLGTIEARIGLGNDGKFSIVLKADQQDSLNSLQDAGNQLEKSFHNSGLQLHKFTIKHGEISR